MISAPPEIITFLEGYIDGTIPELNLNALGPGSRNCRAIGPGKYVAAVHPGTTTFSPANGYANAFITDNRVSTVNGYGNVAKYKKDLYVAAGEPSAQFGVEGVGTGSMRSDGEVGLWDGSGTPNPLEIPIPTIGTVASTAGTDPNINGSVSFKVALLRAATNYGEGPISESSNVVTVTNANVSIPISYTSTEAFDKVRIYATLQGFGVIGPWFWLGDYDLVGVGGGTVTLGYLDVNLKPINPDYYLLTDVPPARHCAILGGHVVLVGAYDAPEGHFILPSKFLKPEQFDANTVIAMNPAEPFTGLVNTQFDGLLIATQANAISALVITGNSAFPILPRNIMNVGCSSTNQLDTVDGEFYVWSEQMGLIRSASNGEPDTSFTVNVRGFLSGFTNPVVVWDGRTDSVIVAGNHSTAGNCYIAYQRGLPGNVWDAPVLLDFTPVGKTRKGGRAILTGGSNFYYIGTGSQLTGTWETTIRDGGATMKQKTITGVQAEADDDLDSLSVYGAYDNTLLKAFGACSVTDGYTARQRCNLRQRRGYKILGTLNGAGKGLYKIMVDYHVSDARI